MTSHARAIKNRPKNQSLAAFANDGSVGSLSAGATGAHHSKCAFSLVELVIVVVIIGIIAAIAIPRIASAGRSSGESALIATLSAFRRTVDTYAAEHGGDFPGAKADGSGGSANSETAFVNQLLKFSNANGGVANAPDSTHRFGPYLRSMAPVPVGPNAGTNRVAINTVNSPPLVTGGADAWVYNPATGEIIANTDDANLAGTRAYDEY